MLKLLRWKVNVDCEACLLAIFDPIFANTLIYRVLRMHVVDDFVPQTLSLDFIVTFVDEGARDCNIQVHDTSYIRCIDNCKVLLVGFGKRS